MQKKLILISLIFPCICIPSVSFAATSGFLPYTTTHYELPDQLDDYLFQRGIDISRHSVWRTNMSRGCFFVCTSPDTKTILFIQSTPDNDCTALLLDARYPSRTEGSIISFDYEHGVIHTQAISPECVQQILETAQSLLLALYDCIVLNIGGCITHITTFFEDITLIASACDNQYHIDIATQHGTVTRDPDKDVYRYKDDVTLTAVPDTGYSFTEWGGDIFGSDNPVTIVVDSDKEITATFTINEYKLSTSATNGTISKSPDRSRYTYGEEVAITAVPDTGYTFTEWGGDLSGSENPSTITMDENKSITASFDLEQYTLTILSVNGTVTKSPDKKTYTYGEKVVLTAVPDSGYAFDFWSGDASGRGNPETITIVSDMDITANFREDTD